MKSPERLKQAAELFHAALERAPSAQAAFLAEACAADPELLAEVQSLLSAHNESSGFMESPAFEAANSADAESVPQFEMGRTIGHYRIVTLLGRGGMGEVYLAQDTRLHRRVALKLLRASFTRDKQRVQRFEQEACAASALNHPNILTVHDLGQADELNFIATEYVEGETLRQLIKRHKVTLGQAMEIAIQVAAALSAAHAEGIIHRDIKPENIMLRPDGLVKVLDFGLAKLAAPLDPQAKASSLLRIETDPGTLMGTVNYMSPEQARGITVDARSDSFSFGVVLYETLTGRPPFEGETASDVIVSILEKEPPPLAWFWPEMPVELQRIVSKALGKDREERYQTVKDLLLDLKSLQRNLAFEAKLEYELTPQMSNEVNAARRSGQSLTTVTKRPGAASGQVAQAEPARAGKLIPLLKRHWLGAALAVVVLLLVSVLAPAYFSTRTLSVASEVPPTVLKIAAQSAHWWSFDEVSGDALDTGTSANPIKAVLGPDVKRVPGRFAGTCALAGGAVEMQDTDTSFVNLGPVAGQFGKRDFTVSIWFKTNYAVPNHFLEMLSNRPVGSHGNFFSLRFMTSLPPPGRIDFALMQGVTPAVNGINVLSLYSRKSGLYDGQWHHLVMWRQGVAAKLFIDGALDTKAETKNDGNDIRAGDGVTDISNGSPLLLGNSPYAAQEGNPKVARGMTFDDVQIFDRALGDEEVAELFGGLTVVIGQCNSNVDNRVLASGCTINDRLSVCATNAKDHQPFVNCVARVTNELMAAQIINRQEKERIDRCAEAAKLP